MKKRHLVAIDTETGGLIAGYHALLSLAAVPTWEAEPFHVWIWPDSHEIDPASLPASGYSVDLWRERKAVRLAEAVELFGEWLKGAPVQPWELQPLAHNAGFDRAFLDASYQLLGLHNPLGHRWRCTQATMAFLQDAGLLASGNTSLNALGGLIGMERVDGAHDALDDARICMAGYHWLMRLPEAQKEAAVAAAVTPKLN